MKLTLYYKPHSTSKWDPHRSFPVDWNKLMTLDELMDRLLRLHQFAEIRFTRGGEVILSRTRQEMLDGVGS